MTVAVEAAPPSASTDITSETMDAILAAVVPELNRCYREALLRDQSLRGDLTIEMTVGPGAEQGIIEDAVVDAEEFQSPLFEQCLLSAMVKLQIPKPAARLYVSYPFTLDPGDEDEKTAGALRRNSRWILLRRHQPMITEQKLLMPRLVESQQSAAVEQRS